ncbi:hypothetical protein [Limnoglobus roseus]|uniref:Uncharacterized protein n=1 Tax=Limnoglobus roseus TaxID=2598579 RepID=A0A5C1ALS1_9BACT|nr:hypothetical protein [Limnoglobus roseus]QEL18682.1 hypothetical protein PX52LOC_05717 [Limnoglobus roseus]
MKRRLIRLTTLGLVAGVGICLISEGREYARLCDVIREKEREEAVLDEMVALNRTEDDVRLIRHREDVLLVKAGGR